MKEIHHKDNDHLSVENKILAELRDNECTEFLQHGDVSVSHDFTLWIDIADHGDTRN